MKRVILLFTVLLMGALQASAAAQANKRAMMMCGEWHLGFLAFPLWYSLQ